MNMYNQHNRSILIGSVTNMQDLAATDALQLGAQYAPDFSEILPGHSVQLKEKIVPANIGLADHHR